MVSPKTKYLYDKYKNEFLEWYRLYFHTIAVTILICFNMTFLLYNAFFSYLSIILNSNLSIPFVRLHKLPWFYFLILANIPLLTWFYSTITQSIKKGYKNRIDWSKTKKGRILAGVFNALPFMILSWLCFARYVNERYTPFLSTIKVNAKYLYVQTLDTLIIFLYLLPIFITPIIIAGIIGEFMKKQSLRKQFFKWEFPLLAKQSFNLRENSCDVIIGWDKKTKKPIVLKENERFLHELVVGATGSGKTSTSILPRIALDLVRIGRGYPCSIILIEPKGDAVEDVLKIAKSLNVPDHLIKVIDPTKKTKHSIKFNPFSGDMAAAAEGFRGTLNSLTGDQDAFFAGQQEETAALFTMLAKIRFGNIANISHIQRMYTEPRYLANIAEQVREEVDKLKAKGEELTKEEKTLATQYDRVVSYFENEVLDYKTYTNKQGEREARYYQQGPYKGMQEVENKKDKFVTGAKKYLNDISMNAMLTELMIAEGDEEVLDLDDFLLKGGVLLVNTALGNLEELSILLGQFMIRQIQSAVFRRPKEENGYKRIPTFLSIDEFPLYANENFERLLTLGRSYKVGTLIALQSLGQLERIVAGYKETIMANASTKTVFGRGTYEDNDAFSKQFGEEERVEESMNESTSPMTADKPTWGFRHNTQRMLMPRFSPSEIQELEFKNCIVQPVNEDGTISEARQAVGKFVNETGILKKFINIDSLELSTKKHKNVDVNVAERVKNQSPIVEDITKITDESAKSEETETKEEKNKIKNAKKEKDNKKDTANTTENPGSDFNVENIFGLVKLESTENTTTPTAMEEFEEDFDVSNNVNTDGLNKSSEEHTNTEDSIQEVFELSDEPFDQTNEDAVEDYNVELDNAFDTENHDETDSQSNEEFDKSEDEMGTANNNDDVKYQSSSPNENMEVSINELLDRIIPMGKVEQSDKKADKNDRQYNMSHDDKKPQEIDVVEDDDF